MLFSALQELLRQFPQEPSVRAQRIKGLQGVLIVLLGQFFGTAQAVQGHKSGLVVGFITANGFAQFLSGGSHVQYVVHDLEHKTDAGGVPVQSIFPVCRGVGGDAAQLRGGYNEGTGFVPVQSKQLLFSCGTATGKTAYAKTGADMTDFAAAIEAAKNGTYVVIGGSKGDDIATYQALIEELGLTEDQMGYITYDSTGDAITAALGGNLDFVISKPAAASQYVESGDLTPTLALSTERFGGNLADAPTLSEVGDYENVEVPVWRGVAAPKAMSDAAVAFWSDALKKVSETQAWNDEYLVPNQLISQYMNTTDATAYVSEFEADYMASNGLS